MRFPEDIHYSRGGSPGSKIDTWETANKLLSYLGPKVSDYAIFQKPNGSYVQCAGTKRRLTVEARVFEPDGSFHHLVFGRGQCTGEMESIDCLVGPIRVDQSQVLQMRHARLIIRQFLERGTFPDQFVVSDVTETFAGT